MNHALLAATALGAMGLYLMLPRERAPLVRLGGLLGAMSLAGLFLYLAHSVGEGVSRPPVYFYLFGFVMVAAAVGVVCQPRPVYAALYFVLVTLAGAGMFVLLLAEFMAIVLIIIYAGAILVTYVFVIMLASQGSTGGAVAAAGYDRRAGSPAVSVAVAFLLVGAVLQVLLPGPDRNIATPAAKADALMAANLGATPPETAATQPAPTPSSVQVLGANLYSQYSLSLELAGILLTIALVGAVVIARKNAPTQPLGTGKLPAE